MEEEAPISIEADDQSAGVRHCFFQLDEDPYLRLLAVFYNA